MDTFYLFIAILLTIIKFNNGKELPLEAYCEFGICNDDLEYCCGENVCCPQNTNLYLLGTAIATGMILITASLLYYYCIYRRRNYTKFHNDEGIYNLTIT